MTTNRFWRLERRPSGQDVAAALALHTETLAPLAAGAVRVAVDYLSMDAGTRMWMGARTDGYQPPLPLGSKMVGLVLGRVIASDDPAYPLGALVRGFGQWADVADFAPGSGLEVVSDALPDIREHFGALGLNAMTALVGVEAVAGVQPGQWLVVSAAAGSTGNLAVQIGRNLGARVVGIAGGAEKCRWLRETLGCEIAIDYRADDAAAVLGGIAGGVHAYFDNVGGPLLDAVLPNMAHYGRVAVCGMVAGYDSDTPLPGPARFDQVLMRRLRIEGFFIPDFLDRFGEFLPRLAAWHGEGRLAMPFSEVAGLENTLVAYDRMLRGGAIGKVVVRVRG